MAHDLHLGKSAPDSPSVPDPHTDADVPTLGLPDDFHILMDEVLSFEEDLTEAELRQMAHDEEERKLSAALLEGIKANRSLRDVLADVFPFLRSEAA